MSTEKIIDEKNPKLNKARKSVSDSIISLLDSLANLENVLTDVIYQRGFDDGVEWVKDEFQRLSGTKDEVEQTQIKPYEPTEVDKIVQESIISCLNEAPGLRTSDITSKIVTLPVKPTLTERSVRLSINRLKNTNKIEDKAGRWYVKGAKNSLPDYQVMRYLPDGGKYLGADIIKYEPCR